MTISKSIYCPSCGQVFHLKFQIDDPIKWSKWPIVVECPGCFDNMELSFSKNGLLPKQKEANYDSPGILIAYCGGLPTPASLYYQEINFPIGLHSIFLVLCSIYGVETVQKYNHNLKLLQNGIVQWSRVMDESYRMISGKKIDPKAYYRKLKSIFRDGVQEKEFQTPVDCIRHYENMIKTVYRALDFGLFKEGPLQNFFNKLTNGFLNEEGPEKILEVARITRYNSNLLKEVRKRINFCIKDFSKILPACFLDFNNGNGKDLFLLTGTIEDINEMYADNFEAICKCLPLIMGLYNTSYNGNPDCFKNSDGSTEGNMEKFMGFDNGSKIKKMLTVPDIKVAFENILETRIRNGINHNNTEFVIETQSCKYFYDMTRPNIYTECRLIDLAYRIIYQIRFFLLIHRFLILIDKGFLVS